VPSRGGRKGYGRMPRSRARDAFPDAGQAAANRSREREESRSRHLEISTINCRRSGRRHWSRARLAWRSTLVIPYRDHALDAFRAVAGTSTAFDAIDGEVS